jgi:hypothetical protein
MPASLVDAETLAHYLNVERSWVYEHAAELGVRRLGTGPKARLRFSIEEVDERLSCSASRGPDEPEKGAAAPIRHHRRRRSLGTGTDLLPVKGQRVAE